jgi:hypothetical protein
VVCDNVFVKEIGLFGDGPQVGVLI